MSAQADEPLVTGGGEKEVLSGGGNVTAPPEEDDGPGGNHNVGKNNLSNTNLSTLPACRNGMQCYRRNPAHFTEFSHPPGHPYLVEADSLAASAAAALGELAAECTDAPATATAPPGATAGASPPVWIRPRSPSRTLHHTDSSPSDMMGQARFANKSKSRRQAVNIPARTVRNLARSGGAATSSSSVSADGVDAAAAAADGGDAGASFYVSDPLLTSAAQQQQDADDSAEDAVTATTGTKGGQSEVASDGDGASGEALGVTVGIKHALRTHHLARYPVTRADSITDLRAEYHRRNSGPRGSGAGSAAQVRGSGASSTASDGSVTTDVDFALVHIIVAFPDFNYTHEVIIDQDDTVETVCVMLTNLVVDKFAAKPGPGGTMRLPAEARDTLSATNLFEPEAELRQRLKLFGLYLPLAGGGGVDKPAGSVITTPAAALPGDGDMGEDARGTWLSAANPIWSYYLTSGEDTLIFKVSPHEVHKQHTLGRVQELDTVLYLRVEIFSPDNQHTETCTHRFECSTVISEVCRTLAQRHFPDVDYHLFVDAVATGDARYRFGLYAVESQGSTDGPAVLLEGTLPLAQCGLRNMDTVQFRPTEQFELMWSPIDALLTPELNSGSAQSVMGDLVRARTERVRHRSARKPTFAGGVVSTRPVLIDKGAIVVDAIRVILQAVLTTNDAGEAPDDAGSYTLRKINASGARFLGRNDALEKVLAIQDVLELRQMSGGGIAGGDGAGGQCLGSFVVRRVPASTSQDKTQRTGFPMFGGEVVHARVLAVKRLRTGRDATVGDILISNFRLVFTAHSIARADDDVHLPLSCIHRVQKGNKADLPNTVQAVQIESKDLRRLRFFVSKVSSVQVLQGAPPPPKGTKVKNDSFYRVLKRLAFSGPVRLFAFSFKFPLASPYCDGWDVFNFEREFTRLGFLGANAAPGWRVSDINSDYMLSDSYPPRLVVPAGISDNDLRAIFKFRSRGRIPALCWRHNRTSGKQPTISRAAQPRVGLLQKRSNEDEKLVAQLHENSGATTLYFMDARPKKNALANTAMGAGFENMSKYKHCKIKFLEIGNIHVMRDSFNKLAMAVSGLSPQFVESLGGPAANDSTDAWTRSDAQILSEIEASHWLQHVRIVLTGTVRVVKLIQQGDSVLLHCSDGWDRTAQLSALAQLCLDPFYRSVRGLCLLIEKEWLSFGHKFAQRHGHGDPNHSDSQRSPVFLQFVDCVWQLTQQFPSSFEFSGELLLCIVEEMFSCRFGTFLFNSDKERRQPSDGGDDIRTRTVSLWTMVLQDHEEKGVQSIFANVLYTPHDDVLLPVVSLKNLRVWHPFFYCYNPELRIHTQVDLLEAKVRELEHQAAKVKLLELELEQLKQRNSGKT